MTIPTKKLDEIADKLDCEWLHDGREFRADLARELRRIAASIRMGITTEDLDNPFHPVGSMRWTYIPDHKTGVNGSWEYCEVVRAYSSEGSEFGPYPELYDVEKPDGNISRAHFRTSLSKNKPKVAQ